MDIDCDWCICGKKTTNGSLYCSEECKLSDCASESSYNSDFSYLSNSSYASMMTISNYMPTLYNKKMNKNYVSFIKSNNSSNKTLNLNTINNKSYANKTMNHPSPTSQISSNKYNKMNMRRTSTGGLITSNMMTMNIPAVTTHVNTSGHIIKTSTSAPKIDIDSVITPPSKFYNRRYSLPFHKGNHQINLPINTLYNTNSNALIPPPIGLLNYDTNDNNSDTNMDTDIETNTNKNANPINNHLNISTQTIANILNNTIYATITQNNIIKNNEYQSQEEPLTYKNNDNTLNYYENNENINNNNKGILDYTKTLKPISEIITTKNNITQSNDTKNINSNNNNNNINDNIESKNNNNNNNNLLYKTNASTNLCALNNNNVKV
ncbi:hypothetical protein LY90DRAFT_670331 [Neocallimastix californiae]|uniref:Uncharacterized protein n=1 Tax=Neocallimastix californiae TaxID=1754190 RepID=A0A1Y2D1Z4_9FUNG|nr:hypothetical protein LY90DRAFT_670331 [Neocallimastix californiae]|eukprot:ORY53311.1 hypothetical protein LY90DRAFT_670331 [Neocallimastix californiae]